ncbi:hypothetical protein BGW36DRAFT_427853 [Talaromyces proteolyticus]|uniref:BTB domain-containing protein n=1 Tax=Talaromyces proteolyticus TaxID=1131652 RepID=A0AAD4KX53_9EURO|nr:uncharacterized protein BGW36DRAFT_427853 [Talaromyces proteolyticus]KAH8697914.1 hypothetical protein BGW36DRAFT_427853 [Talaromyces proteolyticus]
MDRRYHMRSETRRDIGLRMLIHPQDFLPRETSSGFKVFDFMRISGSDTILIRGKSSTCLFRIHKELFEMTLNRYPVAYSPLADLHENVYTFSIDFDPTVARFVEWAYKGEYREFVDLDIPTQPELPRPRYQWAGVNLEFVNTLQSSVDSSNYREVEPEKADCIIQNYPFLVHTRLYLFAERYQISALAVLALNLARESCEKPEKLAMGKYHTLIWRTIQNVVRLHSDDSELSELTHKVLHHNIDFIFWK